MFLRAMDDREFVCERIRWAVWQDAQVAVTVSPFFINPSPWMLSE
jgi:hypothetical protein